MSEDMGNYPDADACQVYYRYAWRNNPKWEAMHDRACVIVVSGSRGSCLVEFGDGQREIVSRRALRLWDREWLS